MMKKKTIAIADPTGNVTTHEVIISRITRGFKLAIPLANPTPITAPTNVWVVEMGHPNFEAKTMVVAAANSAAKPRDGVSSVILLQLSR